ncbi:dienelactone hydrolase family protein [Aeromicrobium piscarium]|uniref:Dienelactone hydrolase n=1 Tax=Aeromicrobium piscarium TaxID=2590901 RepID=A0A554SBG8_9ACTN|nr:dienelactone hydrolase family protein [Aeromicrobium piscarium]TSD63690.1 dienelactone hydrolase [Aeromicrobium piscarium]
MAELVVFHHVQGLTPGIESFAESLREAGHVVHAPDLFEGWRFDSLEAGLAYVQQIGFAEVIARGVAAVQELPQELVYAGFSLGVLPAQLLAQTRSGARGALLMYACAPVAEFGDRWPEGVPVQIHAMNNDAEFIGADLEAARELVAQAREAELFLYPGSEHLFADSSLSDYDEAAAASLLERALEFARTAG